MNEFLETCLFHSQPGLQVVDIGHPPGLIRVLGEEVTALFVPHGPMHQPKIKVANVKVFHRLIERFDDTGLGVERVPTLQIDCVHHPEYDKTKIVRFISIFSRRLYRETHLAGHENVFPLDDTGRDLVTDRFSYFSFVQISQGAIEVPEVFSISDKCFPSLPALIFGVFGERG